MGTNRHSETITHHVPIPTPPPSPTTSEEATPQADYVLSSRPELFIRFRVKLPCIGVEALLD
jgi:hypothetical protein